VTVINLERRIHKIEALRFVADSAIRAISDDDLAQALHEASNDPSDRTLSAWFQAGCQGPLPAGAFDSLQRRL
jgi:hypothetical protein